MTEVRRRLRISPEHSLAYGPHAEANDIQLDALAGSVMIRLRKTNDKGELLREMSQEVSPERARAIAGVLLAKADMADKAGRK